MRKRRIKVSGLCRLSLMPDTTEISFNLSGTCAEYESTIALSAEKTNLLYEALMATGFLKSDIGTGSFSVVPEFENYTDEKGNYKRRQIGYSFSHMINVSFPLDSARLSEIITALGKSGIEADFSVSFKLSDKEAAKNMLLDSAVADCREKAEILAKAAGATLGKVGYITYSRNSPDFSYMAGGPAKLSKMSSFDVDINPSEITVSDTVSIVWKLK
ncbi:MAG: SIMPL domain-containing protein [Ruminococcaceae bacterium]|nr:SIMPL domain-containing protein [Oscillospiraceae bacterium]